MGDSLGLYFLKFYFCFFEIIMCLLKVCFIFYMVDMRYIVKENKDWNKWMKIINNLFCILGSVFLFLFSNYLWKNCYVWL